MPQSTTQAVEPGGNYASQSPNNRGENPIAPPSNSIRTTLRVAFDYRQPNANKLSWALTRRLAEMRAIHCQTPIRVEVQGRTAILQGVAATDHDRAWRSETVRLDPELRQ